MSTPEDLKRLLGAVADGDITPEAALEKLKYLDFQPVGNFAKIDHHRRLRTGFPEVIWGQGKTTEQIIEIMRAMQSRSSVVMATRIAPEVGGQILAKIPEANYYKLAQICAINQEHNQPRRHGIISIISAGTADLPVAEEAAITAELCGFQVKRLWDVGVAGIHRLLSHQHLLAEANVLIVVAGMEGALPSVVAGLVDCPVIAVPTSIGYGASFNGLAALLSMLNSCAAGVAVVNIYNGFGAGILAGQIMRAGAKLGGLGD
jgi:NCAIR mutase (PurE)-related protein